MKNRALNNSVRSLLTPMQAIAASILTLGNHVPNSMAYTSKGMCVWFSKDGELYEVEIRKVGPLEGKAS